MHTSNVGFVLCLLGVCLIRMFIGLVGEIETRSQEQKGVYQKGGEGSLENVHFRRRNILSLTLFGIVSSQWRLKLEPGALLLFICPLQTGTSLLPVFGVTCPHLQVHHCSGALASSTPSACYNLCDLGQALDMCGSLVLHLQN